MGLGEGAGSAAGAAAAAGLASSAAWREATATANAARTGYFMGRGDVDDSGLRGKHLCVFLQRIYRQRLGPEGADA